MPKLSNKEKRKVITKIANETNCTFEQAKVKFNTMSQKKQSKYLQDSTHDNSKRI